jgi:hypothetical protein
MPTSISIMRASAPRVTTTSFSARCSAMTWPRRVTSADRSRRASVGRLAGDQPVERVRHFREADFGEKPEASEIDADERRVVRANARRRWRHRAACRRRRRQ